MNPLFPFFLGFFGLTNAASFGSYYDANCTLPITNVLAFSDVCTWSSNQYSGSFALYLSNCSKDAMRATVYNASDAPTCQGSLPDYEVEVTSDCVKFEDAYVKGLDFTCESQNNTYNVLAHFQADCKDGGVPFSVQLGEPSCQAASFAPGFFNWDTEGSFSDPYYQMTVYNTTNGTCQDQVALFQTTSFPASCVVPVMNFQNISVDIYQAFPVNTTA